MTSLPRPLLPMLGLALLAALILEARPVVYPTAEPPAAASPPPPPAAAGIVAEGRVDTYPGAQVVVGSDLAGLILSLPVKEKDRVRKGQLIAELRAHDTQAAIEAVEAQLREADADIQFYQLEVQRAERLWQDRAGARQPLDRAVHDLAAARARRENAAADARRLRAILDKARIVAPIGGVVLERHADPGESIREGAALVTIADLDRRRIEAEVDEYDTGHVRVGMPVAISAEGYDGRNWPGRVEEIPDNVVLRKIKPQDPARATDTRVLLVKIALEGETPLKLGQRVEVRIGGGNP